MKRNLLRMKKNKLLNVVTLSLLIAASVELLAQVSIWNDVNPYTDVLKKGDLIKIQINEKFMLDVDDESLQNSEMKLRLVPDSKYLDFLSKSEQSRGNSQKYRHRSKVKKKFDIKIIATVESVNGQNYVLKARKVINIDGVNSTIALSGRTNQRYVLNGAVSSENMAELIIQIRTKPLPKKIKAVDNKTTAPAKTGEDKKETSVSKVNNGNPLTEEAKRKILLRYIDEILGALQNE